MQEAQLGDRKHRFRAQRSEAGHGVACPCSGVSLIVPNGFATEELIERAELKSGGRSGAGGDHHACAALTMRSRFAWGAVRLKRPYS